jgi:hypothetical protein
MNTIEIIQAILVEVILQFGDLIYKVFLII